MNVRRPTLGALLVAAALGCARAPERCVPGLSVPCACADGTGRYGAQSCTAAGVFGPCACPQPAAAREPPPPPPPPAAAVDAGAADVAAVVAVAQPAARRGGARPSRGVFTEGGVRTALVCGHLGFRCCSDGLCVGWARCNRQGYCEACGREGGACCRGRCQDGAHCAGGTCQAGGGGVPLR